MKEHNNINMNFEPAKHLLQNAGHNFNWNVLLSAAKDSRTRIFIAKHKPLLNEQVDSKILNLFRNSIT